MLREEYEIATAIWEIIAFPTNLLDASALRSQEYIYNSGADRVLLLK